MLKLINISKTFNEGTADEKRAVENLNLTVEDGDFITIIGSNGAGKSTLFNIIAGNILTDSGSIILDGKDITFEKEHVRSRKIGRLFQDPMSGTCPDLTIEENLSLAYLQSQGRALFSRISRKDRNIIKDKLALLDMGLEDRMNSPMSTLSGGQRQAITLLMATISKPQLLLLDEHTAALDPATADKVLSLTRKIVEENHITTLMITHNMHQALEMGNRTLMMKDGNIVFDCKGEERNNYTVNDLLSRFKENTGSEIDNDRMLLD
ncbi:MAG: ATP-binding cassette domain-containing protein [Erysipelotrichaceae bacterium]|nr:ATP-binding cassette domain-containing protein [Erysipelotrichaceae bacterium]